ncbi:MFS general substrate transporter [Hysterangium stoloniferum]|nr:MFS general substrate transporter [Hysterangium stoloniferum]
MLSETSPQRPRANPLINHKIAISFPLGQVLCLLLLALAESIHAMQPTPYIPKLVEEIGITHGDKSKVGYYVGLFDTTFSIAEAIFILQWSRLSDMIGRKPVALFGTMGLALSSILFGLSKTYLNLILSRALAGVLNANFAVLRGTMAELLDPDSFSRTIPWLVIMWSAGTTIGPLIGGTFYHPYERLPGLFGSNTFWEHYPYFLPCLMSAVISMTTFTVAFCFLREASNEYQLIESRSNSSSSHPPVPPTVSRPSIRSLLTRSLVTVLMNYAVFSCLEVAIASILPIFLSSPGELGGLGFNPSQIGIFISTIGAYNCVFQVCLFARLQARWGSRCILQAGMLGFAAIFLSFPLCIWTMKDGNMRFGTWIILILQIGLFPMAMMSASCITILLTAASPPAALGTANGLLQNTASVFRILGPAATTSLLALSIEKKLAGEVEIRSPSITLH